MKIISCLCLKVTFFKYGNEMQKISIRKIVQLYLNEDKVYTNKKFTKKKYKWKPTNLITTEQRFSRAIK